jgi:hypothetical protein
MSIDDFEYWLDFFFHFSLDDPISYLMSLVKSKLLVLLDKVSHEIMMNKLDETESLSFIIDF